ncbi:MAG TPA: rhomboid family intramembrane serine protease [Bacteroidota bacterium]|nr:rhomboid family intramembrane serine protease [Bacteroidota bacterium]
MAYYRYSSPNYYRPSLFGGFRFFPPVIKALLVSNVVIYLLTNFVALFRYRGNAMAGIVEQIFYLFPIGDGFRPWQLITYMFMHGGLMHLFFNMFALWMFGMELENSWGSRKFLTYYLICGVGAGLSNLFVSPLFVPAVAPTIGASGAIYGVLIAYGMLFPDRPILIYFLIPIRARYFVLLYIGLEVYAGITGTSDGLAHFAHLGGAAVGYIYLLIDQKRLPFGSIFGSARERVYTSAERRYPDDRYAGGASISNATYEDLGDDNSVTQQKIDEILDKISRSGYPSLTEEEKKILFEASKKLN